MQKFVITEDVATRFNVSNFELDKLLPEGKNKKVIGLIVNELDGQIMKEFLGLRAKIYIYLIDNNVEDKKLKSTKKCVINRKRKFEDYKKLFRTSSDRK